MRLPTLKRIHIRIPFFRIFYSTTYTLLFLALLLLLAVTPADQIYQTLSNSRLGNVFVVAGTYFVTALLALFIYTSRLYTNRTALTAIPKSYLPVQKKEVPPRVRRVIVRGRQRSALVAWDSRPRDLRHEPGVEIGGLKGEKWRGARKEETTSLDAATTSVTRAGPLPTTVIPIDSDSPPWGTIAHPGWSGSVSRYNLPEEVRFETVVTELPHLIEAAAVARAPPDPAFNFLTHTFSPSQQIIKLPSSPSSSSTTKNQPPTTPSQTNPSAPPDPRAIALLQRAPAMCLRSYLSHLVGLGVLTGGPVFVEDFLARYEYARFSAHALTEGEFAGLMGVFSELLEGLVALDSGVLAELYEGDKEEEDEVVGKTRMGLVRMESERSVASAQSVVRHFVAREGAR